MSTPAVRMVVTGISKEDAKAMIEKLYGAVMWGIEAEGITAYPTYDVKVVLTSEPQK